MFSAILQSLLGLAVLVILALRFVRISKFAPVNAFWDAVGRSMPFSKKWWFNLFIAVIGLGLLSSIGAETEANRLGISRSDYAAFSREARHMSITVDEYVQHRAKATELGFSDVSTYLEAKAFGPLNATDWDAVRQLQAKTMQDYDLHKERMAKEGLDLPAYLARLKQEQELAAKKAEEEREQAARAAQAELENRPKVVAEQLQMAGVSRCFAAALAMSAGYASNPSIEADGPEIQSNNRVMEFYGAARRHLISFMNNPAAEGAFDGMVSQNTDYFRSLVMSQGWGAMIPEYENCSQRVSG